MIELKVACDSQNEDPLHAAGNLKVSACLKL